MIEPAPQCLACSHWRAPLERDDEDAQQDEPTQVCEAYPLADGGIPSEIWAGKVDHRQPYKGDHGVQWTPDGESEFPDWAMNRASPRR